MFKNSHFRRLKNFAKQVVLILSVTSVAGAFLGSSVFAQTYQGVNLETNADNKAKIQIYLSQAQTLFDQGNYEQSMGFVNKAIDLNSNNPLSWQMLGNCLKKLGRTPEALTAYDQAVKLLSAPATAPASLPPSTSVGVNGNSQTSDIAQIWVERARALDRLNRFQESVAAYDQALKIRCQEQLSKAPVETLPIVCQPYVLTVPNANDPKNVTTSPRFPQGSPQNPSQNSTVIPIPNNQQTGVETPRNNRTIW